MNRISTRPQISLGVTAVAALFLATLFFCSPADAHRNATRAQSRQMWRVVDPGGKCVHHLGQISTAPTRKRFGTVVIADNACGNGQVVLSSRRHARHPVWRVLGNGSDWGDPARCPSDLQRIPVAVLRDFFGRDTCAGFARAQTQSAARNQRSCPVDPAFGNPGAEIIVTGPTCRRATRILHRFFAKAQAHGTPVRVSGFRCDSFPRLIECRHRAARIEFRGWIGRPTAGAISRRVATRRDCGRVSDTPLTAYNLSCRIAHSIWRRTAGEGPPRGWTGANIDVDGGKAFLYRQSAANRVTKAIGPNGDVDRRVLGRAKLIEASVPYGE